MTKEKNKKNESSPKKNISLFNVGDIIDICDVDAKNSPAWGVGLVESVVWDEPENEYKFHTFFPKINTRYWLYQTKLEHYISTDAVKFNKVDNGKTI
jgi:hypothetical protein